MADHSLLTERQQRLYETIAEAARAGAVCPTNRAIAAASGLVSASAVADALGRLQRKGKVRVERFNRARVVHLPELGLATATPPVSSPRGLAPHWRERLPGVPLPEAAARQSFFNPPAAWRLQPEPLVWAPSSCQYIAGDPSADDSVKCGKPLRLGSSYCEAHHALCTRKDPRRAETATAARAKGEETPPKAATRAPLPLERDETQQARRSTAGQDESLSVPLEARPATMSAGAVCL